jgi:putative tricarboxylic transport membrane protein
MLADVRLMLFLGVIGYILRRTGFPLAPIILGAILGPLAESNLERVMTIARARRMSLMDDFLRNEVTIVLMALTNAPVGLSVLREIRHQRSGRAAMPTGDE